MPAEHVEPANGIVDGPLSSSDSSGEGTGAEAVGDLDTGAIFKVFCLTAGPVPELAYQRCGMMQFGIL